MQNMVVNYNPGSATLLEMRANPEKFPRLNAVPEEQAVYEMTRIVSQAFLYKGQAADPTNIQFIASSLVQELLDDKHSHAANISFAEIQVVVKRAVLNSDIFISVSSLYKVITEFAMGEGHLNQKKVDDEKKKKDVDLLESEVAPMLKAYMGEFLKNNQLNK